MMELTEILADKYFEFQPTSNAEDSTGKRSRSVKVPPKLSSVEISKDSISPPASPGRKNDLHTRVTILSLTISQMNF
jgi:hypothetical protein